MQAIWVILIIGVGAYLFLARERVVQPPRSGRMKRRILFAMVLFGFALCASAQKVTAVRFQKLWDGGRVIDGALVLIENGRIRSVMGGNPSPPAGAEIIDWSRYYGLPGLIDMHTHMTYYWDRTPGTLPRAQQLQRMAAETVFLAQENARKTLEAGVTAVRDLGSTDYNDIAMRNLINSGAMVGPRMFVSAYGLRATTPFRPGSAPPEGGGIADSPAEVMKVVRRQIAAGADVIKMYAERRRSVDCRHSGSARHPQARFCRHRRAERVGCCTRRPPIEGVVGPAGRSARHGGRAPADARRQDHGPDCC
jgi:imidazolonepropionase-like amidohydrolase